MAVYHACRQILCYLKRIQNRVRIPSKILFRWTLFFGPIAQSVEQLAFNQWVEGSIPSGLKLLPLKKVPSFGRTLAISNTENNTGAKVLALSVTSAQCH